MEYTNICFFLFLFLLLIGILTRYFIFIKLLDKTYNYFTPFWDKVSCDIFTSSFV